MNVRVAALAAAVLALAILPAAGASAQAGRAAAVANVPTGAATRSVTVEDMRLWSFGDCERQFRYPDSEEHKQCVRIVGSEEARDARAFRVCDTSHEHDPQEAARCKSAYKANKQRAAQDGLIPNARAQSVEPPPPEMIDRVRAIAAAAVEQDRDRAAEAAGSAPGPVSAPVAAEPPPPDEGFWNPMTIVGLFSALMLVGATVARRKQAGRLASR